MNIKVKKRADHVQIIRDRKQRTDIGKYCFVNRTIKNWNQLPTEALEAFPCKPKMFRNKIRSESNYKRGEMKGIEVWRKSSKSA